MPESGNVRLSSSDSSGTVTDSGQTGWNLARTAGSLAIWSGSWTDLTILAGILDGSVCSGQIPSQSGRDPPRMAGSQLAGRNSTVLCRIPATFAGSCMRQI